MTSGSKDGILATEDYDGLWQHDRIHRQWLLGQVRRQLDVFASCLRSDGSYATLDLAGNPGFSAAQELHHTTRLVHSYCLAQRFDHPSADDMIDAGMSFLWKHHRDGRHDGYFWSTSGIGPEDDTKLAYGHVFVLLAAASARQVGHPAADRLLDDISCVIEQRFWDDEAGLLRDEFRRDWTPFSTYRGMNANMHGVEAMLAAHEATGNDEWLVRAGRILDFFTAKIAPAYGWRIPEHYTQDWKVDPDYRGNPMFRPAGTTPGHSFELGRLMLHRWELSADRSEKQKADARALIERALIDAWLPAEGFAYTLTLDGRPDVTDRYWWPVTEAIGAIACLLKLQPAPEDEIWYRRLWRFCDRYLIDHQRGGWFPEIDERGTPVERQFTGKPDIYHSLQATILPLVQGASLWGSVPEIGNAAKQERELP